MRSSLQLESSKCYTNAIMVSTCFIKIDKVICLTLINTRLRLKYDNNYNTYMFDMDPPGEKIPSPDSYP